MPLDAPRPEKLRGYTSTWGRRLHSARASRTSWLGLEGGHHIIDPAIRRAVRRALFVAPLLCLVSLFCAADIVSAMVVGDQIELNATHQAGVAFHQEPRGTNDFQRVPDGTKATVIEVAPDGRWVKLSLPDGRTGWVTSRYVSSANASVPSTGTAPSGKKPQRIEEGLVERAADGDIVTVITSNQTKLRISMLGIDAAETPKGPKFPGQHYGPKAEAYLKRLVDGKRVRVEIFGVDRYKRILSTSFIDGKDINLVMIEMGVAEVYRGLESGNPYKQQYQAAEEAARAAKKGMWILGSNYESPRAYRKRMGIS